MTMILGNEIGRLRAYGSNAPTTAHIPMWDSATQKATYVTANQIASGADAVDGPSSATDNAVARFDDTTGKLIQNSAVTIADTTGDIASGNITTTGAGGSVFNSTALDSDFTVKKLTSGNAISYDAGTNALLLDGTTVGVTGAITLTGNATFTTYALRSVGDALTAAGNNRATALQLAKEINNVTTAAASTGVLLPVGVIGMRITVFNNGANLMQVYATASETIDGTAGSTGVALTNAKRCDYFFVAANTWISAQLGVVSA